MSEKCPNENVLVHCPSCDYSWVSSKDSKFVCNACGEWIDVNRRVREERREMIRLRTEELGKKISES